MILHQQLEKWFINTFKLWMISIDINQRYKK